MRGRRHGALLLLAAVAASLAALTAAEELPAGVPSAKAAAPRRMPPALRRCLAAIGCRFVDDSDPTALAQVAGDRQWAVRYSNAVPLGIVFPRSTPEVAAAVGCSRAAGVKVTARAGGGSFLGYSVRAGTLTIDLADMSGVKVARNKQWADVQLQGGARLGKLYFEVWRQAGEGVAAVAGTCPNVGIAGHMLGGGLSYLSPRFGLSCDSLERLVMVLANGSIVTATSALNSDLFAAACGGGGGNFGIATEFRVRLHRVPAVYAVADIKIAAKAGLDFLLHWQGRMLPQAGPSLFTELALSPNGGVQVKLVFAGNASGLASELRRLKTLGTSWLPGSRLPGGTVRELSWIQLMVEAAGSKAPNRTVQALLDVEYALSRRDWFREKSWLPSKPLPRSGLAAIFRAMREGGAKVSLYGFGEGIKTRSANATGFPWRSALYCLKAAERVKLASQVRQLDRAVEAVAKVVDPLVPGQPAYIGYVDETASAKPLLSFYGSNLPWLQRVKAAVDPTDIFGTNALAIPLPPPRGDR